MVELKRTVKCSNCGIESNFYLSVDMSINELMVQGRCIRCGNSIQINFNVVEPSSTSSFSSASSAEETKIVNIDETLFEPEVPSDVIRDLIED